jgi:hypothetical protein
MNKHLSQLLAMGLLAALGLTLFIHVLATADNSRGGNWGIDADSQQGYFAYKPELEEGDHFRINWEWATGSFRPVFAGGDFYVVEGTVDLPFQAAGHKVVYHAVDGDAGCCGPNSELDLERQPGQGPLTLVWVLDYDDDYRPTGAQTGTGLLGQPMAPNTTAQERELRYVDAFLNEAGAFGERGPISDLQIAHHSQLSRHLGFVVLESLLAASALVFWGFSLAPHAGPTEPGELAQLMRLVERGQEYLRAQLRLQLLVGPLLLMAGAFGAEALDNGGYGFYDPTGFYAGWIVGALIGLWCLAVVLWVVGLVRVLRSLRHYNKTPEPDLGVPVA